MVFSKDLAGCVGHYFDEGVGQQVHVGIFVTQYNNGANSPPIIALNASATSGSLRFSMSNLILVGFGLLIIFRRMWKVVISKS